jgi:hypothetical protein
MICGRGICQTSTEFASQPHAESARMLSNRPMHKFELEKISCWHDIRTSWQQMQVIRWPLRWDQTHVDHTHPSRMPARALHHAHTPTTPTLLYLQPKIPHSVTSTSTVQHALGDKVKSAEQLATGN